jgi:hypothetical protein
VGVGPIWGAKGFGGSRIVKSGSGGTSKHGRMDMAVQYQRYRDEIVKSGGSRRTQDEMRIAGINAALASINYVSAPLQSFIVPEPMKFEPEQLAHWANEYAIRRLLESGQLVERPKEIAPEATRESVIESVLQSQGQMGVVAPVHPSLRFGIKQERMPSHEEVMQWALSECRQSTSVFLQVLRRGEFRRSVSELCNQVESELPELLKAWENQTLIYQSRIDELCVERVEEHNARRRYLMEKNSSVQALVDAETQTIQEQQDSVLEIINSVHALFLAGDPTITTLVLQALLSDNEGSAAPIGFDNGDLLVVMTAPPATEVIWPEKFAQHGRISATKKNKTDINTDFYMFLLSHAVATAREAVVASPHIQRVRVLILDEKDEGKDFFSRRLVAVLDASRSQLDGIPDGAKGVKWVHEGIGAFDRWQQALQSENSMRILSAADDFENSSILKVKDFLMKIVELLEPFTYSFVSHIDTPRSKRPRLIEYTDSGVNTADEIQITISEDVESMKTLDVEVSMVALPDFWVLCGLLGDQWDVEEVDIEALKHDASQSCFFLYPPESINL